MEKLPAQQSKAEQLTVAVRDAIRAGDLAPGRLYSAQELGEMFGVSRTPVREALLTLANAGLVRIERNRGARILRSTDEDVVRVMTMRLLLEPAASGRAARNPDFPSAELAAALDRMRGLEEETEAFFAADRAFHDVILRGSGNARLADAVLDLRDVITVQGRRTMPVVRASDQIIAEHQQIASAVAAGTPDDAIEAMRSHLHNTARLLVEDPASWDSEWDLWDSMGTVNARP